MHFFLENIAIRHDNSMLITVVTRNELHYVPPPRASEPVEPVLLHTFHEMVTGIAELEPDVFVMISNNGYTTKDNYLHRLDLRGWHPGRLVAPESILSFPEQVLALNGCCALSQTTVLAADSFAGAIWRIDLEEEGRKPRAGLWLVNRLANLTPHRRPILTPLRGGLCW